MRNRYPTILRDHIRQQVTQGVEEYLATPKEKRQELEQRGIKLSDFVSEKIIPLIATAKIQDILVIMEEGIGNMIMLTPLLKQIRHTNPRMNITVMGKYPSLEVIENWDVVDEIIDIKDNNLFQSNRVFDLAVVTIWGQQTAAHIQGFLQTNVRQTLTYAPMIFHEALQNMGAMDFLEGYVELCNPHCSLPVGEELKEIEKRVKSLGKYIVLADTLLRNGFWNAKSWPHYPELAQMITKKFPEYKIVLVGSKDDKPFYDEKEWPDSVVKDFVGTTTVKQLAYLLKNGELYVGNDSGPSHVAAAVGVKTYVIFGPTLISKNLPLGEDVHVLTKRLPCSPCQYTERFQECEENGCMSMYTAQEVYNEVFFPPERKKKCILVGDFRPNAHRNEIYIRRILEKEYKFKVIPFEYRAMYEKVNDYVKVTMELVNKITHEQPDLVLINGGQGLQPDILHHVSVLSPKTKVVNWYADNRKQIEPWFYQLSSVCDSSYWHTGDPTLLSQVFSKAQKPCEFLIISPDSNVFYPMDIEKDIDVLFMGTPHSAPRIELLTYLTQNGVNVQIYGDGDWPEHLKKYAHKGVFGKDANEVLNRAKIVVNTNIINDVPLYFSDRYFMPMAVKTVGLNQRFPQIEELFEGDMEIFDGPEDCLNKIKELLKDENKRKQISEHGYKSFIEKYDFKYSIGRIVNDL